VELYHTWQLVVQLLVERIVYEDVDMVSEAYGRHNEYTPYGAWMPYAKPL
jgi:hypothetical protein